MWTFFHTCIFLVYENWQVYYFAIKHSHKSTNSIQQNITNMSEMLTFMTL
jgi:hypothetical protein